MDKCQILFSRTGKSANTCTSAVCNTCSLSHPTAQDRRVLGPRHEGRVGSVLGTSSAGA